eukprot:6207194-Pleurochrysis_carterae.AAC.1
MPHTSKACVAKLVQGIRQASRCDLLLISDKTDSAVRQSAHECRAASTFRSREHYLQLPSLPLHLTMPLDFRSLECMMFMAHAPFRTSICAVAVAATDRMGLLN